MIASLRSPGGKAGSSANYTYERLMQVVLTHRFFNLHGQNGLGLVVSPTSATKGLMRSLGLLFRPDPMGFSVLLQRSNSNRLLEYLKLQRQEGGDFWSRLSFQVSFDNAYFSNFTDMPIEFLSTKEMFYLSNTVAVATPGGPADIHNGALTKSLEVPVTTSQYSVTVQDPAVTEVVAVDLSGNVAARSPVVWPSGGGVAPSSVIAYLDFSQSPEGKYEMQERSSGSPATSKSVGSAIYSFSTPTPTIFLDLLFAQPTGVTTGVYPVTDPGGGASPVVTSTEYFVDLDCRSTVWNYYIVSTGETLGGLQIENFSTGPSSGATFDGPTPVTLPNGQLASWFVSTQPLQLQEKSSYAFRLLGNVGGPRTKNGVLMSRLPVASVRQVIPRQSDFATNSQSSPALKAKGANDQNYSDIYVYV